MGSSVHFLRVAPPPRRQVHPRRERGGAGPVARAARMRRAWEADGLIGKKGGS